MKLIDSEKLKKYVENKREVVCDGLDWEDMDDSQRYAVEYLDDILAHIESLQQERSDKYETALKKAREWMPNVNQSGHAILIDIFPELGEGLDPRYGGRKQEQPEVDLEKELHTYICSDEYMNTRGNGSLLIARHFYEFGLNARKEE